MRRANWDKKRWKKEVWKVFSEYIRRRDADQDGYARCYTCGTRKHWKELQAGHLLDGRTNSILFAEEGVKPQCSGCNLFKSGNKEVYIPKWIDENGREKYDELMRLKHTAKKYSIGDLQTMYEDYKTRLEAL
jgi:hypothetical protein